MEQNQGLTIKQARKVLGTSSNTLSDTEIEKMVEIATFMKNIFFMELKNNSFLQRSMKDSYNEFKCQSNVLSTQE